LEGGLPVKAGSKQERLLEKQKRKEAKKMKQALKSERKLMKQEAADSASEDIDEVVKKLRKSGGAQDS
jgi:pantothenate synthetase